MFSLDPAASWALLGLLAILSYALTTLFSAIPVSCGRAAAPADKPADAQPAAQAECELYDWEIHGL